jgi:hypothetical protein
MMMLMMMMMLPIHTVSKSACDVVRNCCVGGERVWVSVGGGEVMLERALRGSGDTPSQNILPHSTTQHREGGYPEAVDLVVEILSVVLPNVSEIGSSHT